MKIKTVGQAKKRVYEYFKGKKAYPDKGSKIYKFDKNKKIIPVFCVWIGRQLFVVEENGKIEEL